MMLEEVMNFLGYEYSISDFSTLLFQSGLVMFLFSGIFYASKLLKKSGINKIALTYMKPLSGNDREAYKLPEPELKLRLELFLICFAVLLIMFGIVVKLFGENFLRMPS